MTLTDHQLAVRIMALDEGEAIDEWIAKWEPTFPDWGKEEHSGDCTKQPWACCRCTYEDAMARVPDYRRILSIPSPEDDITKEAIDKVREEVHHIVDNADWEVIDGFGYVQTEADNADTSEPFFRMTAVAAPNGYCFGARSVHTNTHNTETGENE